MPSLLKLRARKPIMLLKNPKKLMKSLSFSRKPSVQAKAVDASKDSADKITDPALIAALLKCAGYKDLQPKALDVTEGKVLGQGANGTVTKLTLRIPELNETFVVVLKRATCRGQKSLQHEQRINDTIHKTQAPQTIVNYLGEWKGQGLLFQYYPDKTLSAYADQLCVDLHDSSDPVALDAALFLLGVCSHVTSALKFLHTKRSIVHRDVKAGNILVDKTFDKKRPLFVLADMGSAQGLSQDNLTELESAGTASHTSPEMDGYQGGLSIEEHQSNDIWALGVTLLKIINPEEFMQLTADGGYSTGAFIKKWSLKTEKTFVERVLGGVEHQAVVALVRLVAKMLRPLEERIHTGDLLEDVDGIRSIYASQPSHRESMSTTALLVQPSLELMVFESSTRRQGKENIAPKKAVRRKSMLFCSGSTQKKPTGQQLLSVSTNSARFNQPRLIPSP